MKLTIQVALIVVAVLPANGAAEVSFASAGARTGYSINSSNERFIQTDLYGDFNLPGSWDWGKGWELAAQLQISVGWLHDKREDAFIGTLGPQFSLRQAALPFDLICGLSPTVLSQRDIAGRNFGTAMQFTSHIGIWWRPGRHWELGYRLQHISNGGLSEHNPGLNSHMLLVGYRF